MNKTAGDSEIFRYRKELIHARTQIADLQEELEEKTNLYMNAIRDRDQYKERLNNAKESINRVENIVQSKVNLALEKERMELAKLREENQLFKQRLELLDSEKQQMHDREKQLMDKIQGLTQDLAFYARNADARDSMKRIEQLREEKDTKERHISQLTAEINDLSNKVEDLMAENRTLRKMANVPKNYGINLEQVKLHDREKIDDYKKLIRVLQEDNYRLEEERAKLKHMLKQQSMMYQQEPSQRYKGLTKEQIFKVDQYVMRLLAGETEEPADYYKLKKENQNLKAQLEALNSKGFEFVKNQIEFFFKEKGFGDSNKQLDKLMSDNDELRKMIRELLAKGINAGTVSADNKSERDWGTNASRARPPVPHQGFDGEISKGYSYKFEQDLEVVGKDGKPGLGPTNRYDVACLQLQLVECLELIRRKDDNLQAQQNEIEQLYKRARDYLLVQDQLYKDFVKMEKDYNTKKSDMEQSLRVARDNLLEEQMKVKDLQDVVKTLQRADKQAIENRLIELTKQNSILEINQLRLTRKYHTLEEQEQILRREYHNKEADMAEKDRFVQDRINKLKEWKARAIQQLKFLFQKLRLAVPLSEYQSTGSELEIYKQKNADLIDRNAKMAQRLSKLQTQVRENMEFEEKYRSLQAEKEDAENELEVVTKRLEQVDANFRWENAIFNKIVMTLKRVKVFPQEAFEEFDTNKDGKLTREEFLKGLDMMKITNLNAQDVDVLMSAVDTDSNGYINYREFVRKLSRHGVKSRSSEEQIIFLIIDALKKSRVKNFSEAFELIDKEGRGNISRDDFKDIFKSLNLKIESKEIDKFLDNFWKDKSGGIDYREFFRIFNRYSARLEEEGGDGKKRTVLRVPDAIIRLKKRIYDEINFALKKTGKQLKSLFAKVDIDGSNEIDREEFKSMFAKMDIELTPLESEQIFNSVDFDLSGTVSFPEFAADFDTVVSNDIQALLNEEKDKAAAQEAPKRDDYSQSATTMNQDLMKGLSRGGPGTQSQEMQQQTKIAIMEAREKQLSRKLETSMRILRHAEQSQHEIQDQYESLEKKWNELTQHYHLEQQRIRELEEEINKSIRKTEAERIKNLNESLQTELTETKAAMLSYKNMTEVIADQAKGLKLMIERKKDENENLINAIRELQSQTVDQQRLGKLYYVVMLSRWQEAAANKKYDMILTENKELRKELFNADQLYQNKEYEHHECENSLQDKFLTIEQYKKQLANTKNLFLTLEKAEEFNNIIQDVTDDKSELEEHYFHLRNQFLTTQARMEEAQAKAEHITELLDDFKKSNQTELSDKLIEMSERLSSIRLAQLRAEREAKTAEEKHLFVSKLLKQNIDQLKKLEEQNSEYESKMHKREEEFRRIDNERMKRFFNARFDDISGALAGEGPISARRTGFVDRTEGFSPSKQREQMSVLGRDRSELPAAMMMGGQSKSHGASDHDIKVMEGKIKILSEQLRAATDEIKSREAIINRFKEWQLADKYLSEDASLKEAIDQHRTKSNQVHEQESKEMAEAAYQTIKTLQEMLDQKNEQLRNKEELIAKLRQQTVNQREQDGLEIARLQQQLSATAGTTLSKLQEIVVKHDAQGNSPRGKASKYAKLAKEELQNAVDEKDRIIKELKQAVKDLEEDKANMAKKRNDLINQVQDLEQELRHERQQLEIKANRKELDRMKKELKAKDDKNENLRKAIDELNERMMKYEIQKSNTGEDQKMAKASEMSRVKELESQVTILEKKLRMMESSRNQRAEELKVLKVKEQEKKESEKKYLVERDEARKALADTRDRLEKEIRLRERLQIEINGLRGEINLGRDGHSGLSIEQLLARNKELENDIIILECQKKTVVAYNKEVATFEYIGEPVYINQQKEAENIEDIISSIKTWLARNYRLTVKSIFESMDKEKFGELNDEKFEKALLKLGIKLRPKEKMQLREFLDPRNVGFYRYKPLIRELAGIPQLDFMTREIIKVTKLVEARDLERSQFIQLVDPTRKESMNLTEFQLSFTQIRQENFQMTDGEVEIIFKYVTKSIKTIGVTISVNKFTDKVFQSLDALLIEKMKDGVAKTQKPLVDLFNKFDTNKDGKLEYVELENLFLECQVTFKPNMLARIYGLLDPNHKTSRISQDQLKFYLSEGVTSNIGGIELRNNYEPDNDRIAISNETSQEELNMCRSAARKILSAFQNNLPELLAQKDVHNEGIISREDVQRVIEEQKVRDLTTGELKVLITYLDKGNRGFIATTTVIDKLQELATETKQDTMLRRFGSTLKHQSVNLAAELQRFDTGRTGKLDKKVFGRAMKQLSVALTDEEIDQLFAAGELPDQKQLLDIKHFVNKVKNAQQSKPLPTFISQPAKTQQIASKVQSRPGTSTTGTFENWEAEKKYKKKLEALQQQIEESKKETQAVEKQAKHWQEMANKLEKEKNGLQSRLVDINAKPPKAAQYESLNQGQLEQMQALKDQLFYLQEENKKLERTIQVEMKGEIGRLTRDKEKLEEKNKHTVDEAKRLEQYVNRLTGKTMDNVAQREEGNLWREQRIQELEQQLEEKEHAEQELNEQLFKAEEKLLDLKFQKETYDLQYARLQKRITDLEQYKLASSKFSAVLKRQEDENRKDIEENASSTIGAFGGPKKNNDNVKLKSKSTKSVQELEIVIESLKRVIEKLKSENDTLKRQVEQSNQHKDKLKSEKQLRQRIETLEAELHSYEMKDVNLDEKDKTAKKLLEANRQLREDLRREAERYSILEKKYKDLLVKYNVLAKENAQHVEALFQMRTGGNLHNYEDYLSKNEEEFKRSSVGFQTSTQKRTNSGKRQQEMSYDRTFDDVF